MVCGGQSKDSRVNQRSVNVNHRNAAVIMGLLGVEVNQTNVEILLQRDRDQLKVNQKLLEWESD